MYITNLFYFIFSFLNFLLTYLSMKKQEYGFTLVTAVVGLVSLFFGIGLIS